jgi:hypothetical protein
MRTIRRLLSDAYPPTVCDAPDTTPPAGLARVNQGKPPAQTAEGFVPAPRAGANLSGLGCSADSNLGRMLGVEE